MKNPVFWLKGRIRFSEGFADRTTAHLRIEEGRNEVSIFSMSTAYDLIWALFANPGPFQAFLVLEGVFATGLFRGFFRGISPIPLLTGQNRQRAVLRGRKPACLYLFGQRIAAEVPWSTLPGTIALFPDRPSNRCFMRPGYRYYQNPGGCHRRSADGVKIL